MSCLLFKTHLLELCVDNVDLLSEILQTFGPCSQVSMAKWKAEKRNARGVHIEHLSAAIRIVQLPVLSTMDTALEAAVTFVSSSKYDV
jgi:hypothetical protein